MFIVVVYCLLLLFIVVVVYTLCLFFVCIGQLIPEVFDQYKSVNATLNVMPFCSQFIPMEVITAAEEGSIIYHPSILPKHRGASAINWTLMEGDHKAGFSIFWADDGLDTGPILLQRTCDVDINDTVDTLYNRFLFPEGIRAMVNRIYTSFSVDPLSTVPSLSLILYYPSPSLLSSLSILSLSTYMYLSLSLSLPLAW